MKKNKNKNKKMKKYIVLISGSFVRDVQIFDGRRSRYGANDVDDATVEEMDEIFSSEEYDNCWMDAEDTDIFVGTVFANSEKDAIAKFSGYDVRTLKAIKF